MKGFTRTYFTQKSCLGWKGLQALKVDVLESAHGLAAKNKWDTKVIEDGFLSENEITTAYVEENEKRLHASASLLKDFNDPDFLEKGTQK